MIVRTEDLVFAYQTDNTGTVTALDGISLEIEEGSFTAILGRNGSGKSTLAKNINALLLPSSGVVYVNGYDTKDETFCGRFAKLRGWCFKIPTTSSC